MASEVIAEGQVSSTAYSPRPLPATPHALDATPSTKLLLLATLSAVLLWMCHYPLAWGWLGWVALVPLLALVRVRASTWRVGLFAWAAGLAFFWPVLQWMRLADPRMYATWAFLATHSSILFPVGILLIRRLDRRTPLPLTLTVPLIWTSLEFLRANLIGDFATYFLGHTQHDLPGGFAWYFLGHTQQVLLPMVQIADLMGAYGVTFLVAAGNALIFELLYHRRWFRTFFVLSEPLAAPGRPSLLTQATVVGLLVGAALAYGFWRLSQSDFAVGPRVALIQGNLDQRIRNAKHSDPNAGNRMFDHYTALCDQAAEQVPRPDLIVWPETSYPDDWAEVSPALPMSAVPDDWKRSTVAWRRQVREAAERWKTNVLLGMNSQLLRPDQQVARYNSTLLIQADGRTGGRYDKIHRVPFGEYVPFRESLPWLNRFAPYDFDYSIRPGEQFTRFELGPYCFGVIICYEDTDPYLARQYVRQTGEDRPVDFLLNVSNDGWFDGSSEHEEHLAICRFRAIECRRTIARAVNMGISAVIDGNGRIIALPGPTLAESKKVAEVLAAVLPIDRRFSLYAVWGDWLPWTCWALLLVALAWSIVRRPLVITGAHAAGCRTSRADHASR